MDKWKLPDDFDLGKLLLIFAGFFCTGFIVGYAVVSRKVKKNPYFIKSFSQKQKKWLILDSIFVGSLLYIPIHLIFWGQLYWLIFWSLPFSYFGSALSIYLAPYLFKKDLALRIEEKHLEQKLPQNTLASLGIKIKREERAKSRCTQFLSRFFSMLVVKGPRNYDHLLLKADEIFLGVSYLTKKPFFLNAKGRVRHVIVTGANGMGKTSLALSMIRHDLFWSRPVVFIDPKADTEDIDVAKKFSKLYEREEYFRFFSTTQKDGSCYYNPLKMGSPTSKANKLVFALGLTHEHWGRLAATYLTIIFEVYEILKLEPTLNDLEKLFIDKDHLITFFESVTHCPKSAQKDKLMLKIKRFSKLKDEAFDGLQSGILELNNQQISDIINPSENRTELRLDEMIEKNLFLYIDVNIDSDRIKEMIGKLLVKDLEILANKMQKKEYSLNSNFAGIYIDEFDTFADEKFNNFFKRARSARLALTVLFQGRSGIHRISPHLFSEIGQNAETFIDFKASSDEDLSSISQRPGTMKVFESSQQIDRNKMKNVTGVGTEFSSEVFKLNPNVTRKLSTGQCVIYTQKPKNDVGGESILDLLLCWNSKDIVNFSLSKRDILSSYSSQVSDQNRPKRSLNSIEKRLLRIPPRLWAERLTLQEIEQVRALRKELI
jgi:hypothetical protein